MRVFVAGVSAYKGGLKGKSLKVFESWEQLKTFLTNEAAKSDSEYVTIYNKIYFLGCRVFEVDTDNPDAAPVKLDKMLRQEMNYH